jgi:hydrogenase nickel incorporation protein HypB
MMDTHTPIPTPIPAPPPMPSPTSVVPPPPSSFEFSRLQVACSNHRRLADASVFAANLIGGPGCGKTSLLQVTVSRLILKRRVGIIAADPQTRIDADRLAALGEQVLQVGTGANGLLTGEHVRAALRRMDLARLDLVLIENVSSLIGPSQFDLGEDAKVALFSVAAGDDKPAKYPDVVRCADVVILNKTDLLALVPFDLDAFRGNVRRLNPGVRIIELSTLTGDGLDAWLDWLLARSAHAPPWAAAQSATSPPGGSS